MSADNGIYIIHFLDQSRVIHTQAIDNLWWSFETFSSTLSTYDGDDWVEQMIHISNQKGSSSNVDKMVPTRIVEYYSGAKPMTRQKALDWAFKKEEEILSDDFCPILEYGIVEYESNKTWNEIVLEALELLPREIDSLEMNNADGRWNYEIDILKEMLAEN